jgi:hypothetical protein
VAAGLATTRGGTGGQRRRSLLHLLRPSLRKGSVLFSSFLLFLDLATIAAVMASHRLRALSRAGIGGWALICSCKLRRWGDFLFLVCHPHLGVGVGVGVGAVAGDEEGQRCAGVHLLVLVSAGCPDCKSCCALLLACLPVNL